LGPPYRRLILTLKDWSNNVDLKSLMIDSKSAWVDFPGLSGFSVEISNLSRKELGKLRKRCISPKFDRKTRQLTEQLDEELFVKEFSGACVKNWKGLTLESLETLMLIDTGNKDTSKEMNYSTENAEVLIANSTEFDTWLNEVVFDLDNFRRKPDGNDVEETGKVL
jgi:hypothetical protein